MKQEILNILKKYSTEESSDSTGYVYEWLDPCMFETVADEIIVLIEADIARIDTAE